MIGTGGLKSVSTARLKDLLMAVHRGDLSCPLDRVGLTANGFFHEADDLEILRGLDERGVRAVLVSVLAERRRGR